MTTPPLPEQIEFHRDRMWRREEELRIESAVDAERFIEPCGLANTLTDVRRARPSLYIAVCGRRDVCLPCNVATLKGSNQISRLQTEDAFAQGDPWALPTAIEFTPSA